MNLYNEARLSFDDLTNVANFNDVGDGIYTLKKTGDIYEPGSSNITPAVGGGLVSDANGLRINTGESTEIVNNKLEAKAGSGLARAATGLNINVGESTEIVNNKLEVNPGQGLIRAVNGLDIDYGDNMEIISNKLRTKDYKTSDTQLALGKSSFFGTNSVNVGINTGNVVGSTSSHNCNFGILCAQYHQGQYSCTFGQTAGQADQGEHSSAFGNEAGSFGQGSRCSAFGDEAGKKNQGIQASAFGHKTGSTAQGPKGSAFGTFAASDHQGEEGCAFGYGAAQINQGIRSSAFGPLAGQISQGDYSVSIGNLAAQDSQPTKSIVINANDNTANTVEHGIKLVAGATDVEIIGQSLKLNNKVMFDYGIASIVHFNPDNVTKVKDNEGLLQNVNVTNSGQLYVFTFSVSAAGYYAITHNNDDIVKKYTTGTVQSISVTANTHHEGVCIYITYFGS